MKGVVDVSSGGSSNEVARRMAWVYGRWSCRIVSLATAVAQRMVCMGGGVSQQSGLSRVIQSYEYVVFDSRPLYNNTCRRAQKPWPCHRGPRCSRIDFRGIKRVNPTLSHCETGKSASVLLQVIPGSG